MNLNETVKKIFMKKKRGYSKQFFFSIKCILKLRFTITIRYTELCVFGFVFKHKSEANLYQKFTIRIFLSNFRYILQLFIGS